MSAKPMFTWLNYGLNSGHSCVYWYWLQTVLYCFVVTSLWCLWSSICVLVTNTTILFYHYLWDVCDPVSVYWLQTLPSCFVITSLWCLWSSICILVTNTTLCFVSTSGMFVIQYLYTGYKHYPPVLSVPLWCLWSSMNQNVK